MNYPSTLSNPLLRRRPDRLNPKAINYSNLNLPIAEPRARVKRPFTAITAKGKRIADPLPIKHNFYNASKAELLLISDSDYEESGTESVKTLINDNEFSKSNYDLVKHHQPIPVYKNVTAYSLQRELENTQKPAYQMP